MTSKEIGFWALAFKVLWIVTLTQAGERAWLSALAVWGYTLACGSRQDRYIWRVVVAGILCSLVGDGGLGILEVLETPEGTALGVPPLWLIGLWAAFATLLPICFRWLFNRLWLAGILGAVSGAASYVSGGKLGALMVNGDGFGLVWIAVEWGLALPLLVWLAKKGDANVVQTTNVPAA